MSQISITFKDFTEMKEFARELLKGENTAPVQTAPAQTASAQTVPAETGATTAAYGQQIAEHFPEANKTQVQQTAPTMPQAPTIPQQQTAPAQPQQAATPVQTTAPAYQLEDLSMAAMQLMDKGMQDQLQQLLAGYGVESLPSLPAEQYGNFATALRGMGAQI
ncbi:hypothetical protein [Muricomes intestini]|uniref:hypothetical protein n=1 Tax=Muricomes intestini TaxID=1796634 RepID=UPI002FDDCBC9